MHRACLKISKGAATRDFGCGPRGEGGISPQRPMTTEPTQPTDKRTAARRVFEQNIGWLRCSPVDDSQGIFSLVAPRYPTLCSKIALLGIFRTAFIVVLLGLFAGSQMRVEASEITPAGEQLATVLDSMHVTQLWLAGRQVDWRTGIPNGKVYTNAASHTHCSAFAASAAEKLGVYLLHPPEHSSVLLANAQQEWLCGKGTNQGWRPVESPIEAQRLANQGMLVVVTARNPDPARPGHIAIVRPSEKSDEMILAEGPDIIQAGATNYTRTTTKIGFKHHTGAFENHLLLYFYHPVTFSAMAVLSDPLIKPEKLSASAASASMADSSK